MLAAVLLEANRRYGLRTSGVQFLFWTILLICGIPQLRTQIRGRKLVESHTQNDSYVEYYFWSYLIFYIISLAIWFLNCFADHEPKQMKHPKSENPYPEEGASFLSRLLYTWFDSMAWKGFRRPLEQKDLWDINPKDSSQEIQPLFMKYWYGTEDKSLNKNV